MRSHMSVASLQTGVGSVQGLPAPRWQPLTASHVSKPLQNKPSMQLALLVTLSQESETSLQESSVQPTPSSQLTADPA